MGKTIEETYKSLSDIDHTLLRPASYLGSIITEKSNQYVLENGKFVYKETEFNPAFLKIFDEIISNSIDESKRPGSRLNTIKVEVNQEEGTIMVHDNGGIPVEMHKQTKMYVPQMIFGTLRSSSNYNDDENRTWVGVNGLGSKITCIFSTRFDVITADGNNKFHMTWTNNMKKHTPVEISRTSSHFTKITYSPDLKRFGMDKIGDGDLKVIEKRVYELAGCNPELNICFQGRRVAIRSFQDYCNMYLDDNDTLIYEENKDWKVGVGVSKSGSFQQISYVNSVYTYDSGTHVDFILNQIVPYLREKLNKKYKTDILPGQIKNHLFLFIDSTIIRPAFSSQTKEKLILEPKNFGTDIKLTEKFLGNIYKSEITNSIADWLDQKKSADEKKAEREVNKSLSKVRVEKLIDATGKDRSKCVLYIAEGDSPLASFRKSRNPQVHGAIPIRGKIKNVYGLSGTQALQNDEIKNIFASLGLKIGQHTHDDMRYGEIAFMTDMDRDGDCICALLLNIFYKFFPELIDEKKIFRVVTPLLTVLKGKEEKEFYTMDEYNEWCSKNDSTKWEVKYAKGLAALSNKASEKMINDPKKFYFTKDDLCDEKFKIWFGDDTDLRKKELM